MLKIQAPSGEFFSIPDSEVMTVELLSTLFNQSDQLLGSYSYQFKLDDNEHNRRLLQNAQLITSSQALRSMVVKVWLQGKPWKSMKMMVCRTDGYFEAQMLIDNGIVASKLKTLKLNEIYSFDHSSFVNFNTYADQTAFYKTAAAADPGTYPMTFFPVRNTEWMPQDDQTTYAQYYAYPLSNYLNEWDGINQVFVTDLQAPYKHLEVPYFFVTYVMKRIIWYLGYTPVGAWFDDPDANRLVIDSCVGIDGLGVADMPYYLPDVLVTEFVKAIRTKESLLIDFNENDKTCLVDSWDGLLNSLDFIDLRDYQSAEHNDFVPTAQGFTITETKDDKDKLFNTDDSQNAAVTTAPEIVIGDGSNSVQLAVSTTKMLVENAPFYDPTLQIKWRVPQVQKNYSATVKYSFINAVNSVDRSKFALRMYYYHGMKKDAKGNLYPYASADNLDYNLQPLTAYSLSFNQNNTTQVRAQRFYNFQLASKRMEVPFILPAEVFVKMVNSKKVLLRDLNNATVSAVLDQLTADIDKNEMVLAKAMLYSRPLENNTTGIDVTVVAIPVDNGVVYAKLVLRNQQYVGGTVNGSHTTGTSVDVWVEFYADAAATTAKNVTGLQVTWQNVRDANPPTTSGTFQHVTDCTGTDYSLATGVYTDYTQDNADGSQLSYTQTFNLVDTGLYNIIT